MTRANQAERLKELREKKGISKYAIVEGTGLKYSQINAIEDGVSNYTMSILDKYLDFVGIEVSFNV